MTSHPWHRLALCAALLTAIGLPAHAEPAPAAPARNAPEAGEVDDDTPKPAKRTTEAKSKTTKSALQFKVDRLRLESGWFLNDEAPSSSNFAHGAASLNWQPDRTWEFQLAARVDGELQTGTPDYDRLRLDYGENYVRWRSQGARLTFGTQTVTWGRTDEFPPTDRLSRADLTRFPLDNLADRRRAVPALRFEKFLDEYKIDTLWVPDFRPAALPDENSVWHPFDRRRGRLLGIAPTADISYLIQNGGVTEDKGGAGGGGLRLTRTGGSFDWGVSLQRARQSAPYYRLNPALRGPLLSGAGAAAALTTISGPAFTAVHPMSTIGGGELEFQAAGATWRLEGTYSRDTPVTTTDLRYLLVPAIDVVAGVEFFPGDAETRVTLQFASHSARTSEALLERKVFNAVTAEVDYPFAQGRWRANLRMLAGLNHRDNYVNPKLIYRGFEPHEFYVGAHFFGGDDRGVGGYHRDHDMLVFGWQAKY